MSETQKFSPESGPKITREEVMAGFKKFVDKGATSPFSLEGFGTEEEIEEAEEKFFSWIEQVDAEAEAAADEETFHRTNLVKTMFYVDAGFIDPSYLGDVLHDELISNDWESIPPIPGNEEREKTRAMHLEAMKRIAAMIGETIDESDLEHPQE